MGVVYSTLDERLCTTYPLGVYTKKAKDWLSREVRMCTKKSSVAAFDVVMLPSNETVLKIWRWPGQPAASLKEVKSKVVSQLNAYVYRGTKMIIEKRCSTKKDEKWLKGQMQEALLLAKIIKGDPLDEIAADFGEEAVKEMIGAELDPVKAEAIKVLTDMIAKEVQEAAEDIESFRAEREARRDAALQKLQDELAQLRSSCDGNALYLQ